mgnify:CR=1 FL=1
MYGKGLLKGLKVSLGWFLRKNVTEDYPDVMPNLPDAFHGNPIFDYDKCIACNLCVQACPNRVIKLETETVAKKRVVTAYDFNMQYCMFCGFCQEACNTGAIRFGKDFELTKYSRDKIKIKFVKPEQIEKKKQEVLQAAAEKEAAQKAAQAAEKSEAKATEKPEAKAAKKAEAQAATPNKSMEES